jgi:CRP-like cAMP-binding protein
MAVMNMQSGNDETLLKDVPVQPGMRTDIAGKPVRNIILLSIPDEEYRLLRPYLEPIDLPRNFILHEPGEKIPYGYFLNQGMTSLVAISSDGRSVEVGIVGREGMVGLPLTAGLKWGCFRGIVQIPGDGLRIASEIWEEILPSAPQLQREITRYLVMHALQVGQIAACNRLHELDQRLARWLLMCQDRVDSDFLNLTHEFLAQMLGSGRPSVTLAAGVLEHAGLIENFRGRMRILNRKELEGAACECYGVIQNFNGGMGLK